MWIAAIAITLFCAAGIAAIMAGFDLDRWRQ